jgi:hypothetical protein
MREFQYTENQLKWFDELLSGNYKQGTAYLCMDGKYCCLGVAAEIFKDETTSVDREGDNSIAYDGHSNIAPRYVVEALNLRGNRGYAKEDWHRDLAGHNDTGKTFKQIVEIIKSDPSMYFKQETN